jgi:predicted metal-binding membrane protein
MEGSASLASFAMFSGMWTIMMVAMMLPSTYPTLLLHHSVYSQRHRHSAAGTWLFAFGYFAVWALAGALFYLLYVGIGYLRSAMAVSDATVVRFAGLCLVTAGVYQCTGLKFACLNRCRSPLSFVMGHWRDGIVGTVRLGAAHGLYCFGCCLGLMVILFAMGVMHLGWMAAVGVLILLEKLLPSATWLPKLSGAMMIATGSIVFGFPSLLAHLSSQVTLPH